MTIEFKADHLTYEQGKRVYELIKEISAITEVTIKIDGNAMSAASMIMENGNN